MLNEHQMNVKRFVSENWSNTVCGRFLLFLLSSLLMIFLMASEYFLLILKFVCFIISCQLTVQREQQKNTDLSRRSFETGQMLYPLKQQLWLYSMLYLNTQAAHWNPVWLTAVHSEATRLPRGVCGSLPSLLRLQGEPGRPDWVTVYPKNLQSCEEFLTVLYIYT